MVILLWYDVHTDGCTWDTFKCHHPVNEKMNFASTSKCPFHVLTSVYKHLHKWNHTVCMFYFWHFREKLSLCVSSMRCMKLQTVHTPCCYVVWFYCSVFIHAIANAFGYLGIDPFGATVSYSPIHTSPRTLS